MDYYIKIMPASQRDKFQNLEEALRQREISFDYKELLFGARIYRIQQSHAEKLPFVSNNPQLPITSNEIKEYLTFYQDFENRFWNGTNHKEISEEKTKKKNKPRKMAVDFR